MNPTIIDIDAFEQNVPGGDGTGGRATVRTAIVHGVEAEVIDIEIALSPGAPCLIVAGVPDSELYARVRSAIRQTGKPFPTGRITVLGPATRRPSHAAALDLPIALGLMAADGLLENGDMSNMLVIGSLSFDGYTQRARGVLPIALAAQRHGIAVVLVPSANLVEAAIVEGVRAIGVPSLQAAIAAVTNPDVFPFAVTPAVSAADTDDTQPDLADIQGQGAAKRALEIAAAGGHSLLLVGPPGSGKTMLARRLPGLLPPLTTNEAIETTAAYSVAGLLPPGVGFVRQRPFRAPHYTVSTQALLGGGEQARPGELSLAHHGVLFLDELPEFPRRTLGALRQAVSEGAVWMIRAERSIVLPAQVLMVGAMNPCPCGYLEDPQRECRCTPLQIQQYQQRVSGPMRDRLDLVVHLPRLPVRVLTADEPGEPSSSVRARVAAARERQLTRYAGARSPYNSALEGLGLRKLGAPTADALDLLASAAERFQLSARAHERILRVARTVADLDASDTIADDHVAEALAFR